MSTIFTTDNIDRLRAVVLSGAAGMEITFHSANDGMFHQLYVNGQLTNCSDAPQQRRFWIDGSFVPMEVIVAAVAEEVHSQDFSHLLPAAQQQPSWVYSQSAIRDIEHGPHDRLVLLGDGATGELAPQPLRSREIWPQWAGRWAFGEDMFGQGGFGYDGALAPGMGKGAFGAGPFGLGADVIPMTATLAQDGRHQLVLRTIGPDGQYADREVETADASPPPRPVRSLSAIAYDTETDTLTLQIESN